MPLVDTDWLEKNIDQVKIIDCSWNMPSENRNPEKEFEKEHITSAIFFDLDKNSKQNTDLPHMLPEEDVWNEIVSKLGISKNDQIIIYDNSDVNSACRCWYNFIYFGHDPKLVSVLDGGFKKWKKENRQISNKIINLSKTNYLGKEINTLVIDKDKIDENINKNEFIVIDARSRDRFEGKVAEPREGLRSGSIKNSFCLPFGELINEDHTFISKEKIIKKFKSINFDYTKNVVFSCGSGVTASVLALAYSLINDKYNPTIYDGSWSEYGKS